MTENVRLKIGSCNNDFKLALSALVQNGATIAVAINGLVLNFIPTDIISIKII